MKKITIILLSTALFFSCKKDKKCSINSADISGTYRLVAYTYKQTPTSNDQDYYPVIFPDACNRDDEMTLNANGTYQKTDVGAVCSPPENENGTWSLSGNNMTVDGDVLNIESFDCNTLVIASADFMMPGDKLKITLTRK